MRRIFIFFATLIAAAACVSCGEERSFKPAEVWADENGVPINAHGGGIIFHKGRYWWFEIGRASCRERVSWYV